MTISMTKGSAPVSLSKNQVIRVRLTWPAATDYDAGAEILYKDGTTESIATFGARGLSAKFSNRRGTVSHLGDKGRGDGMAEEIIEILPDNTIQEIAPWAYSAQSNGTGSFYRYGVTMEVIPTEGEGVKIESANANNVSTVYTLVPGVISFEGDTAKVEYFEGYSNPGSELRPAYEKNWRGQHNLTMSGPKNNYK